MRIQHLLLENLFRIFGNINYHKPKFRILNIHDILEKDFDNLEKILIHLKKDWIFIDPAKINPLLSILAIAVALNSLEIRVNSLHVFTNASGVSIKLVISLNSIPSIGKSFTFLMNFLRSKGSFIVSILLFYTSCKLSYFLHILFKVSFFHIRKH